jgi:trk system potassium uptake protein TrkA
VYVLVAGGGKVGYYLARSLLSENHEVLIIERDRRRADQIAEDLGAVVLRGDACEVSTLAEAGASRADVVVATTGDDEDNLVICQLAQKKFSSGRVVARINNPKNRRIFNLLGVDAAVSSTELILAQIQQALPGHSLVHLIKLRAQDLELVEATLGPQSPLVGRTVRSAGLPANSSLLLILRGGASIVPTGETELLAGDEVIALSRTESESALRQLLAGSSGLG